MNGGTVVRDTFAVLHGAAAPVVTQWTYLADDPFTVTVGIQTRSGRWVTWVMARELLLDGLTGPAGVGDVRLRPCRIRGYDVVLLEIESPDGYALLEVDRDFLEEFVEASTKSVELGMESASLDMDAEIAKITSPAG